jgi:hypothetical protein
MHSRSQSAQLHSPLPVSPTTTTTAFSAPAQGLPGQATRLRRWAPTLAAFALVFFVVLLSFATSSAPAALGLTLPTSASAPPEALPLGAAKCTGTVVAGAPTATEAFLHDRGGAVRDVTRFCVPDSRASAAAAGDERAGHVAAQLAGSRDWAAGCEPLRALARHMHPDGFPGTMRWLDIGTPHGACVLPAAAAVSGGTVAAVACDAATAARLPTAFALTRQRAANAVRASVFDGGVLPAVRSFLAAPSADVAWAVLRFPAVADDADAARNASCGIAEAKAVLTALLTAPAGRAPDVILVLPPAPEPDAEGKHPPLALPFAIFRGVVRKTRDRWTQTCVSELLETRGTPLPLRMDWPQPRCDGGHVFMARPFVERFYDAEGIVAWRLQPAGQLFRDHVGPSWGHESWNRHEQGQYR